jgi:hypothetical protein
MIIQPQNITIISQERRTVEFMVNAYGLRGDDFQSITFYRESVLLDSNGNEVKRVRDNEPFEFTPDNIAQSPVLAQAIATIYQYLDGADQARLEAQASA